MIANVLFDEAVAVVAADDRIGQLDVFDHGLEFAPVKLVELAAEDGGDLVGLADGTIGMASSRRSPRHSRATRRRKLRLSQYSTCAKNSRCWQPASRRSFSVKKGEPFLSASLQVAAG